MENFRFKNVDFWQEYFLTLKSTIFEPLPKKFGYFFMNLFGRDMCWNGLMNIIPE